jgi:hypothetical protein
MTDFYSAQLIARKIMDDTGMTLDEVLKLDMDAYARLSGRPTPTRAALATLNAQAPQTTPEPPAALPDTAFTQQAVPAPQGRTLEELALTDDNAWLAWRQNRARGGENIGIFGNAGSWADAARAKAGRSAMGGTRNTIEAPRIEGRYLDHDAQRDMRSAGARFSTPGNSFQL